ncbi:SDR family NAD(P)-dependent oxidoreductase [Thalassotalea ganghwensis]
MEKKYTLIIGANSAIATALVQQLAISEVEPVVLISRHNDNPPATSEYVKAVGLKGYHQQDIDQAIAQLPEKITGNINYVFICTGVLHDSHCFPEKRLEDITPEAFEHVMAINALTPMLWLQKLTPLLTGKTPCKVVVFSARVGSISDNYLGGWYSYRASKAALNMLLKTASIEYARRAKNIKLIAFHPGTTDSPLSKPFKKNVPQGKLFTPEFVAKRLLEIVVNSPLDNQLSYIDWQNDTIPW